jgi:hypothetical protein
MLNINPLESEVAFILPPRTHHELYPNQLLLCLQALDEKYPASYYLFYRRSKALLKRLKENHPWLMKKKIIKQTLVRWRNYSMLYARWCANSVLHAQACMRGFMLPRATPGKQNTMKPMKLLH